MPVGGVTIILTNYDDLCLGNLLAYNKKVLSSCVFTEEVENVKICFSIHIFTANLGGATNT